MLGARTGTAPAGVAAAVAPEGARTAQRAAGITDAGRCEAPAAPALERFGGIDAVVHVGGPGFPLRRAGGRRLRGLAGGPGREPAGDAADDPGGSAGAAGDHVNAGELMR